MLSYRHAFHAGNHADILKHTSLSLVLDHFCQKDKALIYLDTHAGAGLYDLQSDWAHKTQEARAGIQRIWPERAKWPQLKPYWHAIAAANNNDSLRYYPGSPYLAQQLLRPQDKLTLIELHNQEVTLLRDQFAHDGRVNVHHRDGFEALVALTPPTPRRGLVLIDPAYELSADYQQVATSLYKAYQRWPTGTYLVWYPVLATARDASQQLLRALNKHTFGNLLVAEWHMTAAAVDVGMHGSGMVIINAPWQLDKSLQTLLPSLLPHIQLDDQAHWRLEWLQPPR